MHRRLALSLAVALLASQAVWADLTVRYQYEVKLGAAFPAAAAGTFKQRLDDMFAGGMASRVKGALCATAVGTRRTIIDTEKHEITLVDPASQRFARVPTANYAQRVLAAQPLPTGAQSLLQSLKIDVQAKKTEETRSIQGFQAEDHLVILSMEMPNPAGIPIGLRMEIHEWLPAASELARVPALGEISGCSAGSGVGNDPSSIVETILGLMEGPNGPNSSFSEALKERANTKGKLVLKTQVVIFAPGLAAMLQTLGGQGGAPVSNAADVDPNAPLIELSINLFEFSTESLLDTVFQAPEGYRAAPLEDLLKVIGVNGLPETPAASAPVGGTPIEDYAGATSRAGSGVTDPIPVFRPAPKYTEEARRARIEGSVLVSLVVDENGVARNLKVVTSSAPGLEESALDAVRQWKFTPGQKDGNPVAIAARVEVTFRLLDKPPGN
jgi:TonB family protein